VGGELKELKKRLALSYKRVGCTVRKLWVSVAGKGAGSWWGYLYMSLRYCIVVGSWWASTE